MVLLYRISRALHGSQSWFEWRNDLKRLCGHQRVRNIPTMRHLPVTSKRKKDVLYVLHCHFHIFQIFPFKRINFFVRRFHAYLTYQVGGRTFVVRSYVYWIAGKWRKSGKRSGMLAMLRSCQHYLASGEHLDRWVCRIVSRRYAVTMWSAISWSVDCVVLFVSMVHKALSCSMVELGFYSRVNSTGKRRIMRRQR